MEFKGTKGKWYFEKDKEYTTLHNIWSDAESKSLLKGTLIAKTCYAPLSEANALLISKAPEMLEMLKFLAKNECRKEIYEQIEYLIRQATELKEKSSND